MTQAAVWNRPADQVRNTAASRYDAVRSNGDLTPEAKQRAMAAAWIEAQDQLDQLSQASGTQSAADLAAARRAVFGIDDLTKGMTPAEQVSAQMSFRDAQQRAKDLSPSEAESLLDTADAAGDELLVRAIGNEALGGSLAGIAAQSTAAQKYLAMRPDKAQAVDRLRQASGPQSVAHMWEFVNPTPSELNGMKPAAIRALAASRA